MSTVHPFIWLIVLPIIAAPAVYLAGRIGLRSRGRNPSAAVAILFLLGSWAAFVAAAVDFSRNDASRFVYGSIALQWDGLSVILAAVVLALGTLVVVYSVPYVAGERDVEKYYATLMALLGIMIGLGAAGDLFNLWLWFEAMAISSFLLVAFYREQRASLEAGVKYLVQSAAGSVLVLLGIALVLAQAGTLDLAEISAAVPGIVAANGPYLLLAAGALFVIGFGVKAALVPLHTWLPDAHAQAPSGISAMLSGVVIEAGLIALLRAVAALAGITTSWGILLLVFGAFNMLLGNLMALRQVQVKRLLAYSTLSHTGYMLLGLGVAVYAGQLAGAQGGLFHLLSHGLLKGLAFLAAGALLYALHTAVGSHKPLLIADLAGAAGRYPLAALTLSLAVLGLGGLPPLVGFMSKWQIFVAGVATHQPLIVALVAFAAFNSVLSLAYYAPVVNTLYRRQASAAVAQGQAIPAAMHAPLIILAAAVIVIGLWPALVQGLTGPAGVAVMNAFGF
jgi:proton-translocating NADH-quinone oxidoreductase chain N